MDFKNYKKFVSGSKLSIKKINENAYSNFENYKNL